VTGPVTGPVTGSMRFSVDGWDPGYGTSSDPEEDLGESTATVDVTVEMPAARWRAVDPPSGLVPPAALLFVDGVRRIEARVWIDDETPDGTVHPTGALEASAALCASYAAGVVCCCRGQAHLVKAEPRRGLFTVAPHAADIATWAGTYTAEHTKPASGRPLAETLSQLLQQRMTKLEVTVAVQARSALSGHGIPDGDDLLIVDGPLRQREHLPRALGYIKSHRSSYLPPELNALVGTLATGQRTPVFLMGTSWDRHSWYLRLPRTGGPPWSGVVRVECSADLTVADVVRLAGLSQVCLPRFSSTRYKDPRAPQNLYPISGLERELRRRLGDPRLLYRALSRSAAA
jgi:hypothetical protein